MNVTVGLHRTTLRQSINILKISTTFLEKKIKAIRKTISIKDHDFDIPS